MPRCAVGSAVAVTMRRMEQPTDGDADAGPGGESRASAFGSQMR